VEDDNMEEEKKTGKKKSEGRTMDKILPAKSKRSAKSI